MSDDRGSAPVGTIDKLLARFGESASIGITETGAAADRRSLFAAAGFDWPPGLEPEGVHARQTDYPFSVDVGGGQIVAALDRVGQVRRAVRATGLQDVRGASIPGVYTHKQLEYWSGRIGWSIQLDGRSADSAPAGVTFIGEILPLFSARPGGVELRWIVGSRCGPDADPVVHGLLEVRNTRAETTEVLISPVVDLDAGDPGAVTLAVSLGSDAVSQPIELKAGDRVELGIVIQFGPSEGFVAAGVDDVAAVLERELVLRTSQFGTLCVTDEPWFAAQPVRLTELARQSCLYSADGTSVGSFWGSNANPIPDVWFRDLAYTTLALVEFDPVVAADHLRYLVRFAIPDHPWEREAELLPDATGLEHSLGNACLPAVVAGVLARVHGPGVLDSISEDLQSYLGRLVEELTSCYQGPGSLFRTLYISDGPSRGLFHTGSNILAVAALRAIARDLRELTTSLDHERLAEMADELQETIDRRCVTDLGGFGPAYVEGIYGDGRAVAVHDGEESDLTLASYYGYTARDDSRVIAHARWARSTDNPYYTPVGNGVDFWDWDDYNGVTYPAHAHALAETRDPASLRQALEVIRRTTDADGSLWWWPFAHGETDTARVKRGLSKCGWSAGVIVARLMHDVFGIRRSWRDRTLTVAPFTPWTGYAWRDLPFGPDHVDIEHNCGTDAGRVLVRNRTGEVVRTSVELPVPIGAMIEDIRVDGENGRYESEVVQSYGGSAVRITREVAPGSAIELAVTWSKVVAR